jgi:hypothetical protein
MPGNATPEKLAMEQKRSSDADQEENTMRLQKHSFTAMGLAGVLAGFAGISVGQAENADVTYKAELSPLNSKATGSDARGEATFTISGDQLTIHVSAKGVSPNMEHLQHLMDLQGRSEVLMPGGPQRQGWRWDHRSDRNRTGCRNDNGAVP